MSKDRTTPYRRLGLIGDVHAEDEALHMALEFLGTQSLDAILCTGDVADGPGDINRCCDLLQSWDVITVRGNHDRWMLNDKVRHVDDAHRATDLSPQSLAYLTSRPTQVELATTMGTTVLCHGMLDNDLAKIWPGTQRMPPEHSPLLDQAIEQQKFTLLLNGHMHYRTLIYFNGLTLLNAGTLRSLHRPGFSVLDLQEQRVEAFEFNADGCYAVKRLPLLPDPSDKVWPNSAAFDGVWEPTVLYADS